MELALAAGNSGIIDLSGIELDLVNGGINWEYAAGALATGLATGIAIIAAPETAGLSLLLLGAAAGGASTGIQAGLAVTH